MAKTNNHDLKLAMMEVARADTGAGGLADMTGKAVPLKRDRSPDELDPPEMAVFVVDAATAAGAPETMAAVLQVDIAVPDGSEGLEERLADRLEEVMSQPALLAEGVDAALSGWRRRDLSDWEASGRRIVVEAQVRYAR